MEITRRQVVAAGACVAGMGTIAATAGITANAQAQEADYASRVAQNLSCDVVVIGAGASGLAASVEALLGGADVVTLEALDYPGGSGRLTDCILGIGTEAQKAGRVTFDHEDVFQSLVLWPVRPTRTDFTVGDIISVEMNTFNGEVDGERWHDMLASSADNIVWLGEQGVEIEDACDNYMGHADWNTAHWWVNGGVESFVDPLVNRIEELGGRLMLSTRGRELILDGDGAVAGVYAEGPDGVVQIDAKAVIIATGGFGDNAEMLESIGCADVVVQATPGHHGDGIDMAIKAGGKSWLDKSCLMMWPFIIDSGSFEASSTWCSVPSSIWVNGNGVRFVDENFASHIPDRGAHCLRTQERTFAIHDDKTVAWLKSLREDLAAYVDESIEQDIVHTAGSVEELADAMEVDGEALAATIERYNANCEAGQDVDFGKKAECLVKLEPPFYWCNNHDAYQITSLGGIDTTAKTEVRGENGGVVKGLFAVGADGTELWKGLYTLSCCGACNANNVYTGRIAAQMALQLL